MPFIGRLRGRSGTSLIEVLITLGIFVTGMVYVLRMFPSGFLSLRHDENVTVANRLAQSELERLESRAANLPSAICQWGWNGVDHYAALWNADPDDMNDQQLDVDQSWPSGIDMRYFTDVNKFRRVISEATQIPVPVSNSVTAGSIYVLQFSPVLSSGDDPIMVYGGSLRRRWMGAGSIASRLKSYGDYVIDYDESKIYLRSFTGSKLRNFVISYSYWSDSGGILELQPATVWFPVNPATTAEVSQGYVEINIPAPPPMVGNIAGQSGFQGVDRASDSVARAFDDVTLTGWSDDPYEFKLIDPISGVLAFNPMGYEYSEYTARGKTALTANIDYTVMDWHIIREERRIPDNPVSLADMDAKLTLRFIKKSGDTMEGNGSLYTGMAPYYGMPYDVVAVDVETGAMYVNTTSQDVMDARPEIYYLDPDTMLRPAMDVDYRTGTIRFDPNAPVVTVGSTTRVDSLLAGKTFRIFYCAEGDWAIQTYKAYDVFQRSYGTGLDQRQYYFSAGIVYLARSCAGSTVAVDFAYTVNGQPQEIFTSGQVYQVSRDTAGSGSTYINLAQRLMEVYGPTATIDITRITRVYGVSLGVRAVWRESGRGFSGGRWRKVDLQTYLTRPAQ